MQFAGFVEREPELRARSGFIHDLDRTGRIVSRVVPPQEVTQGFAKFADGVSQALDARDGAFGDYRTKA